MDLEEIKQILQIMEENGLIEFEMERDGLRIALRKAAAVAPPLATVPAPGAPQQPAPETRPPAPTADEKEKTEENIAYIRSPMVGTFYVAPSPDSPPFVTPSQTVGKDDIVCILEAMKVMNEIKAEVEGRILEVLVENGEPVEYGHPLFRLEVTP